MGCSIGLREGEEELDLIVYIYPRIYKYPGVGTIKLRYQVELEATGFHFYVDGGGDAKQRNHKKGARQISTSVLPGEMTREVRSVLTYRIHVQMSGRLSQLALAMKAIKHAHTSM